MLAGHTSRALLDGGRPRHVMLTAYHSVSSWSLAGGTSTSSTAMLLSHRKSQILITLTDTLAMQHSKCLYAVQLCAQFSLDLPMLNLDE